MLASIKPAKIGTRTTVQKGSKAGGILEYAGMNMADCIHSLLSAYKITLRDFASLASIKIAWSLMSHRA